MQCMKIVVASIEAVTLLILGLFCVSVEAAIIVAVVTGVIGIAILVSWLDGY